MCNPPTDSNLRLNGEHQMERVGREMVKSCWVRFISVTLLLITIMLPELLSAGQIRIIWDPNTEGNLSGYKVYYGTSSWAFGDPIKLNKIKVPKTTYILKNLIKRETYY